MGRFKIRLSVTVDERKFDIIRRALETVIHRFDVDYDLHTEEVSEEEKDPALQEEQRMAEAEAREDR